MQESKLYSYPLRNSPKPSCTYVVVRYRGRQQHLSVNLGLDGHELLMLKISILSPLGIMINEVDSGYHRSRKSLPRYHQRTASGE